MALNSRPKTVWRPTANGVRGRKQNRPKADLWPGESDWDAYFLGLQVGQVAQVVLLSAQQAMPQAGFLASHLPQQAQPLIRAAMPRTATHRVTDLMSFIMTETVAGEFNLSIPV